MQITGNKTPMKKLFVFFAASSILAPLVALAASPPADFKNLVKLIIDSIITPLIALIFALAFLGFLWGAAQFVMKADEPTARTKGKDKMLYGLIALAVMFSAWGLVKILTGTFGLDTLVIPLLQTS